MFCHEERWAATRGGAVPVDHLIDLDTQRELLVRPVPTQADLYERFCLSVRRDLVVALPPVTFTSGGSVVADAIDPGVTSATAGSAKASPKKKTWQEKKPAADVVSAPAAPHIRSYLQLDRFLLSVWICLRPGEPVLPFSVGLERHPYRLALPVYISRGV